MINHAGAVAIYDSELYNSTNSRKTLIEIASTANDVLIEGSELHVGEDGIGVAVEAGYANELTITGTQFLFEDHTPSMYVTSHLERDLGVLMQGAQNGTVLLSGNTFDYADFGVYAYGVTGNGAITVGTESNGNTFKNSYLYGVYFAASAGDVVVSGNTINDPLETATNAGSIWLTHANGDVEVNGNTITMVQSGITLNNTGNGSLELDGNEIVGVTNGILFTGSGTGAASISGNEFSSFRVHGISILESNSTNLQITNNSFSSTYDGALPVSFNLATYNSDLSVLTGNAFSGFAYNAIGIHGTMQRNLSFTGNLCVSFDLDLNGHTLTVSDTLSVVAGDVLVNGGTLNVGSYIQSEGMKLVLNSNNDVKNVHVSESFLIDDWSDLQFGSNVTVNVNTYVTGNHTVLNGPGTNYWVPSNPDTLHGTFAKGIWQENSYCYIEYPIYNTSGTVTEYRRGYVPYANVFGSFVPNHDIRVTAYVQDGHVYNLPSTESQIVGTFYGYIEVSIIDEENDMVYVEYQYDRYGAPKRGYVLETQLFDAATAIELLDDTVTLYLGGEYQLNVQFTPSNAKNKEVAWSCEPSNVITISDTGAITAIGLGTATVTAKAKVGGATDTCTVKVEELALTESNVTMVAGQTHQLLIALVPGQAGNQEITFSSDNPSVATVDPVSGLVTAIKAGTAVITAKTKEGTSASCLITIKSQEYKIFKIGEFITPESEFALEAYRKSDEEYKSIPWSLTYEAYYSAAMATAKGGEIIANMPDAARLLEYFLSCVGKTQIIDFKSMNFENLKANEHMYTDLNNAIDAAEYYLECNMNTVSFTTTCETEYNVSYGSATLNISNNWYQAINSYRTWYTCSAERNGSNYIMTIEYNMRDFYDWDPESTMMAPIVSPKQMYTLHCAGMAKNFKIEGSMKVKITWSQGQTLGTGALMEILG